MRTLIRDVKDGVGSEVELAGWVNARRDHGKIIFIDLHDRSGLVQLVFTPKDKELYELASKLRPEWVVRVAGTVKHRPAGMENPNLPNGTVEVPVQILHVENEAATPPFALDTDGYEVGEEIRMQYRYLDLRRARLARNLRMRSRTINALRQFLLGRDFTEVETPILTKSTPEGARDYLVPSRVYPGTFYALPQSPQQYKQLLMVAGLERYFQVAKCFRDEDTRGDRQPEFTQLDIEMSFIEESELMDLVKEMVTTIIAAIFPEKRVTWHQTLSYDDAMAKYNSDKPDLRKDKNDQGELALLWVVNFPLFEYSEAEKRLVSVHHPFTAPQASDLELLDSDPVKVKARAYDLVLNGFEVGGGSIRIHQRELQERVFKALGITDETAQSRFGHLLRAFEFGAPPHGGIALGLDRLFAILFGEPNIREVMAFPKTGDGRDLMMDAPSDVSPAQLKELGIEIAENIKRKTS
ncbi:MAG: aspartate--tRNA ligase [bacterium]|nr:aspartate--tRNA ligase [bacterium]